MKTLSWLLATLFLSPLAMAVLAEGPAPALPTSFDKASKVYRFVSSAVFDIDKILTEIGINVYACKLDNSTSKSYRGVGACIYGSANYTFKEKKPSIFWLWVINPEGKYLPPLKLEWKTGHKDWGSLGGEFAFLSFENFFGRFTRKINRVVSEEGSSACTTSSPTDRDLGNFIGDISITFPKGHKVSEYFVIEKLDGLNAEQINMHAATPFYLNKKRAYKVQATIKSDGSEYLHISMLTNFNLVSQRDSCFKGSLQRQIADPAGSQLP
ncbi:MAG: hypothetical protein JNM24_08845 [Bdellovibrionaceae bacterium]|nr:hypothetical protein [Pseudobdellovibrionaceae bacterium]